MYLAMSNNNETTVFVIKHKSYIPRWDKFFSLYKKVESFKCKLSRQSISKGICRAEHAYNQYLRHLQLLL